MKFIHYEKQDFLLSVKIGKTLNDEINKIVMREEVNKSSVVKVLLVKGLECYKKENNKE